MSGEPRVAVILDENTSGDSSRYEASKGYFSAVRDAGGLPFGIPYLPEVIPVVVEEFNALICAGGRFAFPDEWYMEGTGSSAPYSERLTVERALIEAYLERDKPVLGICAGMQLLAGVQGCLLWADVQMAVPDVLDHDKEGSLHEVDVCSGTRLAGLVGSPSLLVNTFHREAVGKLSASVVASAFSKDGIIEAIELPSRRFAIGLQWHQERFAFSDHAGNAVFRGLVEACR